ncbi:MAG: hypothetical protein M9887_02015 [Chitinophagales bacterium]|nr:hypothetical protein [Chitinophagales bacterium]
MNNDFPILKMLSTIIKYVSYLGVLIGAYLSVYEGILEPMKPRHYFSENDLMQLITGVSIILFSLVFIAFSELIQVFLAIEKNTRKSE